MPLTGRCAQALPCPDVQWGHLSFDAVASQGTREPEANSAPWDQLPNPRASRSWLLGLGPWESQGTNPGIAEGPGTHGRFSKACFWLLTAAGRVVFT